MSCQTNKKCLVCEQNLAVHPVQRGGGVGLTATSGQPNHWGGVGGVGGWGVGVGAGEQPVPTPLGQERRVRHHAR